MRTEYIQLAKQALKEGRLRWLTEQVAKRFSVKLSDRVGRPLMGPILGSILVTYRCDNRCLMCDYPQEAQRRKVKGYEELSEEELMQLVYDFKAIGSSSLSFTGGEPLIRKDIFRLLHAVREQGMLSNINSNGNLLSNHDLAEELLKTNVDLINISVDGSTADVHDHLRGVTGGFDKLCHAIEYMNALKEEKGYKSLINVVTVVSTENLKQIPDMIEFAKKNKINRLGFMPVHNFDFMDVNLQTQEPEWLEELDATIEMLKKEVKTSLIDNSVEYLDLFKSCFLNKPLPIKCYTSYHTLMINTYGEIFPCFPWIEKGKSVGNIRETPLVKFWASEGYNEQRKEISKCRDCYWNCTTELNLVFN